MYVRQYCAEIDEAARNRMELIVRSLAEQNGVTDFVRQYTLASGGPYCDCGYKKKGS